MEIKRVFASRAYLDLMQAHQDDMANGSTMSHVLEEI